MWKISEDWLNPGCITSYEVVDAQRDLDNSMLVIEGTKIMRSHNECDEAGPSGESSSNDVPHLKRNQTYIKDVLFIITLIAWFILLRWSRTGQGQKSVESVKRPSEKENATRVQ
ncbi:hypothetical protein SO802_010779 [Lithocarpus litseifolius]|uniref:Uncharacterized protein n=1 Tax=Lithocarpus litseifolius TaxID=425828 RepID=A0AAW2DF54_9ROSI